MKVTAINGSPHKDGNTAYALNQVGAELQKEGIGFEVIEVGGKHVRGCIGCGKCAENQNEKCNFTNDIVNEVVAKMKEADGIVIGSPVYYSGIAGTISEMLIPSSNYWTVIHGLEPGDATQDAEGVQIMQMLGENMVWMLKMQEASKNIEPAESEKIFTNFIR
jgi:multimeric flavodoxin WrbA